MNVALQDPHALPAADRPAAAPADIPVLDAIRRIGRGAKGARALDRAETQSLFRRLLAGSLLPEQVGAILLALRVKGETVDELLGVLDALDPLLARVDADPGRPAVAIPSYNGARNAPNLVPLLACLLADAGVQVVVHGVATDPGRVTTAEVFSAMGIAPSRSARDAASALGRRVPAFVPVDVLGGQLAWLLLQRRLIGVRNVGHSVAKMLDPFAPAEGRAPTLRIASYTHPEFDALQRGVFQQLGASALVMRATEGEAVASTKRAARIDWLHDGTTDTLVEGDAVAVTMPELPSREAAETARWIQSVLAGERPVPPAIAAQVDAVLHACGMRGTA